MSNSHDHTAFYLPLLTLCVPIATYSVGVWAASDAFWAGIFAVALTVLAMAFALVVLFRIQDRRNTIASHEDDEVPDWSDVETPEALKEQPVD